MSALGQGLLEGQQFGQQFNDARTAAHQRSLDEQARQAQAGAIPGAPAPQAQQPGMVAGTVHKLRDIVVGFYDKLHHHTLNDAHEPNGAVSPTAALPEASDTAPDGTPIPPQEKATMVAARVAATDPSANAGIPQTPKKAHSMTAADDDALEDKILAAARTAAAAGEDPAKVYANLSAIKTAHYQGNILKNLNAAGVALQRGDTKAVEQALKNVYYYFPNGEELNLKHDGEGRLLYQDPFQPQKEDGSDNMIPVDAAHIQMLGQAAIDATKLQDTITASKTASTKRQVALANAQANLENAQSNTRNAGAREREAVAHEKLIPSQIYANTAKGAYDEARSKMDNLRLRLALTGRGTLNKNQQAAANDASAAVFSLAQGLPTTVPVLDAKGNPNLSPAAGKTIRDPSKIPEWAKGKSPDQLIAIAGTAGHIAAANLGSISKEEAASLAAQLETQKGQTHEALTGGNQGNVKVDPSGRWVGLWRGYSTDGQDMGYRMIQVSPLLGAALQGGRSVVPTADEAAGEEGGDQDLGDNADPGYDASDPNDDPSYHIPAIPAQ